MSTLGETPGRQGGIPGAGKIWLRKIRLSQKEKDEMKVRQTNKEKFLNFFKKKETEISATTKNKAASKSKQGIRRGSNTQQRLTTATGRRTQRNKINKKYTLAYKSIAKSSPREKQKRVSLGKIPHNKTHNGRISTIFGHTVEKIDNRATFRALFQNPNGIDPSAGNYQFLLSLSECYNQCVSLIGLSETNREWKHIHQQKQLRDALHKVWKSTIAQTSSTIDTFEENYKPGGTLTVICEEHWTSRVLEKGEDPWGLARWTYTLLAGKKDKKVLSVNGYRVCSSSESTAGETTAWKQQFDILRERLDGKIDPRRQCILDMQTWLMSYIQLGIEVIFYLDGNEDITHRIGKWCEVPSYVQGKHDSAPEHDGSLATLVTTCGLVDVLKEQHSSTIPPTYVRGKKRLDYVFVTPRVMNSVERSSLLLFHTCFGGDHRPIIIDFNAEKLFGDPSHEIQRQKSRGLKLNDPRIVNQYRECTTC
mmetsp:Transcript_23721/g.33981  ORF Transcript_23721/g.33981 Transcript_23721/m.33981 type:complete len:478 (-) Transcript_23721:192-1625(-)